MGFLDNSSEKIGGEFFGLPVYAPDEASSLVNEDSAIVIASAYQGEIYRQLVEDLDIEASCVYPYLSSMFAPHFHRASLFVLNNQRQWIESKLSDQESINYFRQLLAYRNTLDPRELKKNPKLTGFYRYEQAGAFPLPGQAVIDVGAYTGDTAEYYLQALQGNGKIIAIEANPANFASLSKLAGTKSYDGKIVAINSLLGQFNGYEEILVNESGMDPRSSRFRTRGVPVNCKQERLDTLVNALNLDAVDYIKMDIEGGEADAIAGAEKTIRHFRPNLAIAAYHRPNDIIDLIKQISRIDGNYQFFLGHHPVAKYEVELYCVYAG